MTTFTVKFDCDNAAFDNMASAGRLSHEIGRILRDVARRVEQDGAGLEFWETILDSNGNNVGRFACKQD